MAEHPNLGGAIAGEDRLSPLARHPPNPMALYVLENRANRIKEFIPARKVPRRRPTAGHDLMVHAIDGEISPPPITNLHP